MTFAERVRALEPLGFTLRQRRFVAIVALHGGYCIPRQYRAFAGVQHGKNVREFFEALIARKLAVRFVQRADRGLIYHLQARSIYRALDQDDNRNRRAASAALIARKIMVLDYVLARLDVEWLATEADKIELFEKRCAVPIADLPQHVFTAVRRGVNSSRRYFMDKLPIALVGEPSVAHFVYLATDATGRGLDQFIENHARLFAWLPNWRVVAISPSPAALEACRAAFDRQMRQRRPASAGGKEDLQWFFSTRQTIDQGELSRLPVTAIDRFRTLREQFSGPTFDALYAEWQHRGDASLEASGPFGARPRQSHGELITDVLNCDYSQFGSLPGVA